MVLVNDSLYWLLSLHMGRHGQDASTTRKHTQDVEKPINLTINEKPQRVDDWSTGDQVQYGIK